MEVDEKTIKELTLLLLYLTGWEDQEWPVEPNLLRSWKGYPFWCLNELREEKLIFDSSTRSKSIHLSQAGEEAAQALVERYLDHKS